jgi:serine/threonine protein kinase
MPEWTVPEYTQLKELGSGGFGKVMLAQHNACGVLVAIKYLRAELLGDPMASFGPCSRAGGMEPPASRTAPPRPGSRRRQAAFILARG